jgi:hypothetical protein
MISPFVGHVVVESHRLDLEVRGERAHGQGTNTCGISDRQRTTQQPFLAQRHPLLDRALHNCSRHCAANYSAARTLYGTLLY